MVGKFQSQSLFSEAVDSNLQLTIIEKKDGIYMNILLSLKNTSKCKEETNKV